MIFRPRPAGSPRPGTPLYPPFVAWFKRRSQLRGGSGQRSLNRCSGRDFQHEVFAPTGTAAFHSQTVAAGMLLQQRPTRRVLSYATAKLLRDEAESMVPNIDPEQVRKLAGWGADAERQSQLRRLESVPPQPAFLIVL